MITIKRISAADRPYIVICETEGCGPVLTRAHDENSAIYYATAHVDRTGHTVRVDFDEPKR
jgi:hypothetical protein